MGESSSLVVQDFVHQQYFPQSWMSLDWNIRHCLVTLFVPKNSWPLVTEKAMLVTNAGKLDGQMLKNIGAVIVSAEAANMRLGVLVVLLGGVLVVLLGFEMFFFWVEERISAGEMDVIFIETTASQTTLVDRPLIF